MDSKASPVPNADVTVSQDGVAVAHTTTNESGQFSFSAPSRQYEVLIRAAGFASLRTAAVPFSVDESTQIVMPATPDPANALPSADKVVQTPNSAPATTRSWEYGVLAQGGVGTSDRSDFRFFLIGGHAGKILTSNLGSGLFQGNFEYAVEVFPFWQSYTPRFQRLNCTGAIPVGLGNGCSAPYTVGGTYTGVSVTPIILRWNLTHGQRWMPWLQGAGGVVWTNHKYPAIGNTNPADIASNGPSGDTSVWNFTPQFGIGTHYLLRPRRSLDFSANAVHISSASLGDKNPGVNASVQFSVGYTWWK